MLTTKSNHKTFNTIYFLTGKGNITLGYFNLNDREGQNKVWCHFKIRQEAINCKCQYALGKFLQKSFKWKWNLRLSIGQRESFQRNLNAPVLREQLEIHCVIYKQSKIIVNFTKWRQAESLWFLFHVELGYYSPYVSSTGQHHVSPSLYSIHQW